MTNCYIKMKESLGSLTNSERRIAKYIVDFPREIISMPIDQLAANCDSSKSSVVRMCKSLGYKGYKDLCVQLNADLLSTAPEIISYKNILPNDDLRTIVENISANNIKSIENSLSVLDYGELERAVEAISAAKRVDFYGCGNSALVAKDAQYKFIRINKHCNAHVDPHLQILAAANLTEGDVAVIISYTGETRDILRVLEMVRRTKAVTISITKYGTNSVSKQADIRLYTASLETLIRSGAMSSRIGQLNVVDFLFSAVASHEFPQIKSYLDRTSFATRMTKTSHLDE